MNKKVLITLLFILINLLIFLFRNEGFEYKKYSSQKELYPDNCDSNCIKAWDYPVRIFTQTELIKGKKILAERIGIDSFSSDEKKMVTIAGWLYADFYGQFGTPTDSLSNLSPLEQFRYLESNREAQLHCGNFQPISSFFFTAARLPNRLIQNFLVNPDVPADSHVVNEVFLKPYNKWVLTDGYQNHLMLKQNNIPLSAAEYLDYAIATPKDSIFIAKKSGPGIINQSFSRDQYFNSNYVLFYYKDPNLSHTYSALNKLKRYFLASYWYEIYAPQQKNSNLLFRIKQLFIAVLAGWILFLLLNVILKKK